MNRRISLKRSGISILLVLVCLIVVTTIVGTMLHKLLIMNRQTKQQAYAAQARCLAESGLERAAYRLRVQSDYQGETWTVQDPAFTGRTARVEIQVEPNPDSASEPLIRVLATYPYGIPLAVKTRREAFVSIGTRESNVSEAPTEELQNATR